MARRSSGGASAAAKRTPGRGAQPHRNQLVSSARSGRAAAQKSDKTRGGKPETARGARFREVSRPEAFCPWPSTALYGTGCPLATVTGRQQDLACSLGARDSSRFEKQGAARRVGLCSGEPGSVRIANRRRRSRPETTPLPE